MMPLPSRGRSVIVGGGIAGLVAAPLLREFFAEVVVVERDSYPPDLAVRKRTPQAPHTHILGAVGYRKLLQLFPGIDTELAAAGAPEFDYIGDCLFFVGRWAPRFRSGLVSVSSSRMLLESAMRRRVADLAGVRLLSARQAIGYRWSGSGDRVVGVAFDDGSELSADLVVDAAGVGSHSVRWLVERGFERPRTDAIDLRGASLTRLYRPRDGRRDDDWTIIFCRRVPGNPRQGALSRIEGGLWRATVWGVGGVMPGRSEEGFLEFARALPDGRIHELLQEATPASPVYFYGNSHGTWIRYEQMKRFPDGLAVIGDAVFHPNAEHAQGMTFCLQAADLLAEHVRRHGVERPGASRAFQRRLAGLCQPYWHWNVASELSVPGVEVANSWPRRLLLRYYQAVRRTSIGHPDLWKAAMQVTQAERHPRTMFAPSVLARVARAKLWPEMRLGRGASR